MMDDEQQETSENNDSSTGPVADEGSSSSQAAGEDPTSAPPADETPESEAVDEGDESAPADETSESTEADEGEPVAEEADEAATVEEPVAEEESEPAAEEADEDEVETAEESEADEAPAAEEKKKDAIPGADLEPIAVEPEGERLSAEERARREADEEERARREAALTGEVDEDESDLASRAPAKMESDSRYLATGKRKRSIARVTLLPGSGKIEVNSRSIEEFFPRPLHQTMARQPLVTAGYEGSVDVRVRVHGGGVSGQAGAVRHGIARALTEIDPELRGELKRRGFLTRDARVKERRKAGLKKARKKPQFSKR